MKKNKNRSLKNKRPVAKLRKLANGMRFLPAVVIVVFASILSWQPQLLQPKPYDVLAYATNTSPSGLLGATNTQRINNGRTALSLNSKLTKAAQNKAKDMVERDYWSHVTPDGEQPWVFISEAGYKYVSAGENLAYGFLTSGDTVTGWMNSPSHKQNMLSTAYSEVGFGIANSEDFVGDGEQTVVVAMYGAPQVAAVSTTTPSSDSTSTSKPKTAAVESSKTEKEVKKEPALKLEESIAVKPVEDTLVTTASAQPAKIERVKLLTSGAAIWSASAIIVAVSLTGLLWIMHRGLHIRRYVLAGEHFLARHIHLDLTVLAMVYLGFVLLTSAGAVR